jgi:hypothetical protein
MEEQQPLTPPQPEHNNPICGVCALIIETEQPKVEFMCHHFIHTLCMFQGVNDGDVGILQCTQCNDGFANIDIDENDRVIIVNEEEQRTEREQREDEILELFRTNPQFKKDLKNLINASKECNAKRSPALTLLRQKKLSVRAELLLLKEQITNIQRRLKQEVQADPAFKQYKTAYAKISRCYNLISTKYGFHMRHVRYCIGTQRGFRRLINVSRPSYRSSPHRLLRKLPYVRVRM